jgi:hypothetical protein
MPILLARTIEFVHIEPVSALFTFRLGQVLLYIESRGCEYNRDGKQCRKHNIQLVEAVNTTILNENKLN